MTTFPPIPGAPTPPTSRWSRNWKWFLPTGCLGLILLAAAAITGFVVLFMGALKGSDAYKLALEKAQHSPQVMEKLGQPIQAGWYLSGSINVSGPSGDADISFPVSGPKGKGTVFAVAKKTAGEWHFQLLHFQGEGQTQMIDLLPPGKPESPEGQKAQPAITEN